jgi:hypothetical protein
MLEWGGGLVASGPSRAPGYYKSQFITLYFYSATEMKEYIVSVSQNRALRRIYGLTRGKVLANLHRVIKTLCATDDYSTKNMQKHFKQFQSLTTIM